ncbi:hypothetical protein MMC13_000494 [Lambiella insularis]|nr:hypothetical protein [Lambiella insularis]
MPAAYLANYQASSVVMGLTPTLLASFGPSVAETSLLSSHRPILSFLISLGAPAVHPTRVFDFTDPYTILEPGRYMLRLPRLGHTSAILLSMVEYVCALAAAVTIATTSIQLGANSILAWGCTNQDLPLVWTTLSVAIHVTAAVGYRIALNGYELPPSSDPGLAMSGQAGPAAEKRFSISHRLMSKVSVFFKTETCICANDTFLLVREVNGSTVTPRWGVLLSCWAGLLGLGHVMFGTLIFASLSFVTVYDFMNYVLWRYIMATVVCRVILMIELTGLRAVKRELEEKGMK